MSDSGPSSVAVVRPWGTILATGPDRISWLNGLVTCDVSKVSEGVGAWGLLLTKRGKIVAELTLVSSAEGLFVGTPTGSADLTRHLEDFLVMEDVELSDQASSHVWIQVHGPGALQVASGRAEGEARGRVDWLSSGGAAVVVERARLEACLAGLRENHELQVLDESTWEAWRVAHGLPEFGIDFGSDDNPHQAGLDRRAVSWTKGCYLGQEVVCMQDMRGKVKRSLAKLLLPNELNVDRGDVVKSESGEAVGSVTSVAATSLLGGQPRAAIAQLHAPHFEPGSTVYLSETPLKTRSLWG